jgi:hypothetical protein
LLYTPFINKKKLELIYESKKIRYDSERPIWRRTLVNVVSSFWPRELRRTNVPMQLTQTLFAQKNCKCAVERLLGHLMLCKTRFLLPWLGYLFFVRFVHMCSMNVENFVMNIQSSLTAWLTRPYHFVTYNCIFQMVHKRKVYMLVGKIPHVVVGPKPITSYDSVVDNWVGTLVIQLDIIIGEVGRECKWLVCR